MHTGMGGYPLLQPHPSSLHADGYLEVLGGMGLEEKNLSGVQNWISLPLLEAKS